MIDLWSWSLDVSEDMHCALLAELSPHERARADRFVFERDHLHFVAGRGRLRRILSNYLAVEAADIAIEDSERGKPRVRTAGAPLYFNLSHSGPFAALGVSRDYDIGVDIEQIRPVTQGLAERFFAPGECQALDALPERERLPAFFRCWTRKEAFVKASGDGLQRGLATFVVDIADAARTRLLHLDDDPMGPSRWTFLNFSQDRNVIGAVAVPSIDDGLKLNHRAMV